MGGPDKGHEPDGEPAGGAIPAGGQKLSPDPGGRGGDGGDVMVLPEEEVLCCGLVYFALFEAGMPDPLPDAIALPDDVLSDGGHPKDLVLDLRGRRERGTALKTLEDLVLDDEFRGDGGSPRTCRRS